MRLRSSALAFVVSTSISMVGVGAFFVACSSATSHPSPSPDIVGDGESPQTSIPRDGGGDAGLNDAGLCASNAKDGTETDVDCGGTDGCQPCALGQACMVKTDCALGADCTNKLCALCDDKLTDGDESDTDCGGRACGGCTLGKHCSAPSDCASNTCTKNACACPKDMTVISLAGGGTHCIDPSEVSKGQYVQFIAAKVPLTSQADSCLTANTTFTPRGAWPPAAPTVTEPAPLEFSMGLPVHYVDWCDAVAYCKWAKKELCGAVGGGALALASSANPTKSAWFNACSAHGTRAYPYAGAFDNQRCNTDGVGSTGVEAIADDRGQGFGYALNGDDGVYRVAVSDAAGNISGPDHTACSDGMVGVYQMSGNVAEWENSCAGAAASDTCRVRGGSYADTPANQTCAATRDVVRMLPEDPAQAYLLADVGFRCCQY